MLGTYRKRVISLDVGGTHQIRTSQDLLCKVEGSLLQQMFCGVHDLPVNQHGNIFLDRDGSTFLALINYLRNNRDEFPQFANPGDQQLFVKELQFWDLNQDLEKYKAELGLKDEVPKAKQAEEPELDQIKE